MATNPSKLKKELEQDLSESTNYVLESRNIPLANEISVKYYNAVKRIMDICSKRNRF